MAGVSTVTRLSDFEVREQDFTIELRLTVAEARELAEAIPDGMPPSSRAAQIKRDLERHLGEVDDVLCVQDIMQT